VPARTALLEPGVLDRLHDLPLKEKKISSVGRAASADRIGLGRGRITLR
jgi:hypothetical protein